MGRVDWLCSDMACYPERLLRAVRRWLDAGTAARFVCTLKFQGETDHEIACAFAALPYSRLMHLLQPSRTDLGVPPPDADEVKLSPIRRLISRKTA